MLRRWRLDDVVRFYTCARPGRSISKSDPIADEIVTGWLNNMPASVKTIVSLLGTKPNGRDEHSFYSFFGRGIPFEMWLNSLTERKFEVISLPTVDFKRVSDDVVTLARAAITERFDSTVLLLDSGGQQRTGFVCRQMGAAEYFDN